MSDDSIASSFDVVSDAVVIADEGEVLFDVGVELKDAVSSLTLSTSYEVIIAVSKVVAIDTVMSDLRVNTVVEIGSVVGVDMVIVLGIVVVVVVGIDDVFLVDVVECISVVGVLDSVTSVYPVSRFQVM